MDKEEKLELKRQAFHLLFGIILVILYKTKVLTINSLFIIFLIGFITSFISLRCRVPVISWFLKNFEREEDLKCHPGKGILMYVAGALLVLLLFEENTALAAIMVLAAGDSVSHIFGKHFGKYRFKTSKHLEGTVAGIFFASLAASMFVDPVKAFIGSTVAMATEAIELKIGKVIFDDNLAIPVIAGLAIYLAQMF